MCFLSLVSSGRTTRDPKVERSLGFVARHKSALATHVGTEEFVKIVVASDREMLVEERAGELEEGEGDSGR